MDHALAGDRPEQPHAQQHAGQSGQCNQGRQPADGNAYEIRVRYGPSGGTLADLAVPGNIILATPEPASL